MRCTDGLAQRGGTIIFTTPSIAAPMLCSALAFSGTLLALFARGRRHFYQVRLTSALTRPVRSKQASPEDALEKSGHRRPLLVITSVTAPGMVMYILNRWKRYRFQIYSWSGSLAHYRLEGLIFPLMVMACFHPLLGTYFVKAGKYLRARARRHESYFHGSPCSSAVVSAVVLYRGLWYLNTPEMSAWGGW
ncbi:hypothetical protein [Candidatus Villigracilis saccharophilus]|uniref:hypothetical protein n=1 Tax=Candidatus Villigracilis saccharophilus TaxID=3140684 RepID=UPI0031355B44|nr:hypothetical protein [Anaerolineales bacterium]